MRNNVAELLAAEPEAAEELGEEEDLGPRALWMVARADDDEVLVFQEKGFADEESADEEARSSGWVVIPLPVARDYRPGRKRAEA
jgi:hypothetical protein